MDLIVKRGLPSEKETCTSQVTALLTLESSPPDLEEIDASCAFPTQSAVFC